MDLELLHNACKIETRNAFEEYKRQIEVRLFLFDECLNDNLKEQMHQDIIMSVTKHFFNHYNLTTPQITYLSETINQYKGIAEKTANNYSKRLL